MPNEFIIKNGFRSQGNSEITGSIITTGTSTTAGLTTAFQFNTLYNGDSYKVTNTPVLDYGDGLRILYAGGSHKITMFTNSGTPRFQIVNNGNVQIGTTTDTGAKLTVLGSGTTSATTALLVQNSNSVSSLTVKDDGSSTMLSSNEIALLVSHTNTSSSLGIIVGNGSQIAPGFASLKLNGSTDVLTFSTSRMYTALPITTNASTVPLKLLGAGGGTDVVNPGINLSDNTYNAGGYTATSGTQTTVQISGFGAPSNSVWKPASGTATYNLLAVVPVISGSGTYSGTIRGIYYNPTVNATTYGAHRAIETTAGDIIINGGSVGLGTTTPSASLHISGSSGSALLEIDSPAVNNILFVSGSGNVGINTGTPSRALEVFRSGLVDGSINGIRITTSHLSATAQAALEFIHPISGISSRIATDVGSGGLTPSMYFIHNGVNAMKIANTGNVQIGTTTDAGFKLDVSGTARTTGQHTVGTLGFTGGGSTITSIGNSYINFYTRGFRGFDLYNGNATAEAQKVLIGNFATFGVETSRYTAAMLVIESTTKGFLPPRTSATSNISSPGQGLITYVITSSLEGLYYYNSGSYEGWTRILNNSGSQSITGGSLTINKSGSTVLDIQGSQGQLFSVVDALSGSLMSVNDVSGLPILEVFSDDRVVMGTYGAPALIVTGSNTIISGSLRGRVVTLSTASATASMDCSLSNFFDLTLSGSMFLGVSNIQPGETINLRITQPATSGSLNYTSSIKFPNGLPYSASATSSVVDLISFISFDSSTLYATSLKNLI